MDIKTISTDQFQDIVENMKDPQKIGLYLIQEGKIWVACDNSTGDAWTEEFKSRTAAVEWLKKIY
jgi:hypothetical protein